MPEPVVCLHISDIHFREQDRVYSQRILRKLLDDARNLGNQPDLVFITGDLAFGQGAHDSLTDQFRQASEFLDRLRTAFTPSIPKDNVFIVPGNHDVNRTLINTADTDWLGRVKGQDAVSQLIRSADRNWARFMERLWDYREFLKTSGYDHLLGDPDRLVYSIKRQIRGVQIGIAGLNSAWGSSDATSRGEVWMGALWQLNCVAAALEDIDFSFVLNHYPASWLALEERHYFETFLEKEFSFSLHGHEHTDWITEANGHVRVAAGASFQSPTEEHGYNVVRLNLDTGEAGIALRVFRNDGWVPDIVAGRTDRDGVWPVRARKLRVHRFGSPVLPADAAKDRVFEASMPRHIKVQIATQLTVRVRRPESERLSDILEQEGLHSESGSETGEKGFKLLFPKDALGNVGPTELDVRVSAPQFDLDCTSIALRVFPDRDTEPYTFLLTPRVTGDLLIKVEIWQHGTFAASRMLHVNSQISRADDRTAVVYILLQPVSLAAVGAVGSVAPSQLATNDSVAGSSGTIKEPAKPERLADTVFGFTPTPHEGGVSRSEELGSAPSDTKTAQQPRSTLPKVNLRRYELKVRATLRVIAILVVCGLIGLAVKALLVPGAAVVAVTTIPPSNSRGGPDAVASIAGRVEGSKSSGTKIVLYAYSGDRWWVQPFDYAPFTEIEQSGTWHREIHSGTRYAALLVNQGYKPPSTLASLPEVGDGILARTIVSGK